MSETKFMMPAEWEKHSATLLAMPHQKTDWPGRFEPIEWVYTEIIKNLSLSEEVFLIVKNELHKKKTESFLQRAGVNNKNIIFKVFDTDRSWLRDSSPFFVRNLESNSGKIEAVHFKFNGWAKYGNWKKDYHIPAMIAGTKDIPIQQVIYKNKHVVLEGGAIDVNGRGTLITTEECLMSDKVQVRNKGFSKEDYLAVFKKYLGIEKIIWLKNGIAGDDTHGHIDDLCRFVNPGLIVVCSEKNMKDMNYNILEENRELLEDAKLENGSKPDIVKLPMPSPVIFEGQRLPASYANFYISNNSILVPTFNDPEDRIALGTIAELFPNHKVTGIHSLDLVWGLGTLHCLSHELPK